MIKFYTIAEAAKKVKRSVNTLKKFIEREKLPYRKCECGLSRLISEKDLKKRYPEEFKK